MICVKQFQNFPSGRNPQNLHSVRDACGRFGPQVHTPCQKFLYLPLPGGIIDWPCLLNSLRQNWERLHASLYSLDSVELSLYELYFTNKVAIKLKNNTKNRTQAHTHTRTCSLTRPNRKINADVHAYIHTYTHTPYNYWWDWCMRVRGVHGVGNPMGMGIAIRLIMGVRMGIMKRDWE